MKATLEYTSETGRQRYYKLSEPIKKGISDICGEVDIPQLLEYVERSCLREYKTLFADQIKDGIHHVCVSDAHTHIERLVFPAVIINGRFTGLTYEIDGKHTMMIDGGYPEAVYDDAVYLRHLAIINKLSWEGVEK